MTPAEKQQLKDSHISTWITPEYTALIQAAVKVSQAPRRKR
jgi:hypothetical protein